MICWQIRKPAVIGRDIVFYYSTSLSEVQITRKTSTNIPRYLFPEDRFDRFFRLSIGIRSAQFSTLQSVLRNRETIISLTISCHSISVFLFLCLKDRTSRRWRKTWKKTDLLSNQFGSRYVTLVLCHAFSLWVGNRAHLYLVLFYNPWVE